MIRMLLALSVLSVSAVGFLALRQSTTHLRRDANATREAWMAETQRVMTAHSDQVELIERTRALKQALGQFPAVEPNAVWSALQTERKDPLTPELRERLLEELGFNWQSSKEFIVVSKKTMRDLQVPAIRGGGKLAAVAVTVFAMTPEERGQVEAVIMRVKTDFKEWVLSHTERGEPKDDVLARYSLLGDPALSISNNFVSGLFQAVGRQRGELIIDSSPTWMSHPGIRGESLTMTVKRYSSGNEERLRVLKQTSGGLPPNESDLGRNNFPEAFRPLFPTGWADVAKREGFELPEEAPKK
jgi:hypothetical protein